MEIIQYIGLGALAGTVASLVLGARTIPGLLMDILLGVFGAITGGVVMYLLGQPGSFVTRYDEYSSIVAALGAIVWIWVGSSLELDKDSVGKLLDRESDRMLQ